MSKLKDGLVILAVALVVTGGAAAQGWDHRGGDHGGDRGRGRSYERRDDGRGYDRRDDGRRRDGRGYDGYDDRRYEDRRYEDRGAVYLPPNGRGPAVSRACGDFAPCQTNRPDYAGYPPGYAPRGGARSWRRGELLPHAYWSGEAVDPRRYRLRSPPPGYGWYGVGRDAYLVQRSTGLILDTAPGAW